MCHHLLLMREDEIKMTVAHLATVDLSLKYLLLPQLEAVMDLGGTAIGISAPGEHVADLEVRGIRHEPLLGSTRSLSPIADTRAVFSLWKALRRLRPHVLHTHTPKPGIYGRILGRLAGVPVVLNTNHGMYASPDDRLVKKLLVYSIEALAARFSDRELIQSREDYELVTQWRITKGRKTLHLGNGIDLERFKPDSVPNKRWEELRHRIGAGPDEIVVGSVGRLVAEKGFREIFEAASELKGECKFIVIGPRESTKSTGLSETDFDMARKAGVSVLGMQENVEEWYAAMDIFVLASHREGFPRAAMEAAAMGLPVVATDIRGCREVVDHGKTGLLTPVREPESLVESIRLLASSAELRKQLGVAGAEKARNSFDERQVVRKVLSTQIVTLRERGQFHRLENISSDVTLRPATRGDAAIIASLHSHGISTGFLRSLGLGFLNHLYAALIGQPGSKVVVACDQYGPVAFVAGVADVRLFYKRFFRSRAILAAGSAIVQLIRPTTWRRVLETARYDEGHQDIPAELLAMAVAEPYRGRGIGKDLVSRMLRELASDGVDVVKVVVGSDNDAARGLYASMGFIDRDEIEVHRGEPSIVMVRGEKS